MALQRLRKHQRVDNLGVQQRAGSVRWGRMVYLSLLTAFGGTLTYYLIGGIFILSIDGTVMMERHAVDASYPGKIVNVFVKEGAQVEKGTPLLRLESFDMVKEIADLALRDGELALREGQLQGRLDVIRSVAPLAERSARESTDIVTRFDSIKTQGIVPVLTKTDALRGSLQASERVAELSSQEIATEQELALLAASRNTSIKAMEQLRRIFDDGYVRASGAGFIGARVPVIGDVVTVGESLMEINGGEAYVLAYLPDRYLFAVHKGMAVNISAGSEQAKGRIDEVLTVADALPEEFQNQFRPRDRSRLVRIALEGASPFAVSQKVWVTGCAFGVCWAGL
jgi:multidrug resistance efflux pump